jgi:hypothetical protein
MRHFMRRLSLLAALLILGFLAWGAYYVCNRGFSRHWRVRVSEEFRRRGLDLFVRRITLDPIHGFVARDVEIFDSTDPDRVMASVDRVALDINLTNLIHGRQFLDAVDLENADLSIPINPDDPHSERVKISQLNARVIFPQHEWYVSQADAIMYGVHVSAHGRLLNPDTYQSGGPSAPGQPASNRPQIALDFLKELGELHYAGEPPRLDINFGGDVADPLTLYADVTVWGQKIQRGPASLSEVYAALALRSGVIALKQFNVTDAKGEMDATGSYDLTNGRTLGEMRSTLDPVRIAHLLRFDSHVAGWSFPVPPVIELSGSGTIRSACTGLVTGHIGLGRFGIKQTSFKGGGADFSWDGTRWYVRNGWIGNASGVANVRVLSLPGAFRAQIDSGINPNSLSGLLQGDARDAIHDWNFVQSPKANLNITGTSANPSSWETRGAVFVGRTLMRGVPLDWGWANVEVKGLLFTYRDFTIQRDEGTATGTFSYDFGLHEAWLTDIHAHINTTEAAVWINPDLPLQLAPYRFKTAPDVSLNGFVQCANDKGTHLDVHVDAPGGMDYTFCKHDLFFPRMSGGVLFREHEILLKGVSATLCNGAVDGNADIRFGKESPGYVAAVKVAKMDFASITKLYFNYGNSHGLLSGAFDFGGLGDDPWTLYGKGSVEVTDGNVFAIPVLGPFSSILNNIVPNMGYNVAHDGVCTFAVENGIITTRDFVVKGLGFSMIGDGRLLFLDDRLNFNIRLNAQGLPGVLLFPMSKLLEYAGTGTLEEPVWKPVLLGGGPSAGKRDAPPRGRIP